MGKVIAISRAPEHQSTRTPVGQASRLSGKRKGAIKDFKHRREMLSKIHIAKRDAMICKNCGRVTFYIMCPQCKGEDLRPMEDFDYRRFLKGLTRKISCKDMTKGQLHRVLETFRIAGFQFTKRVSLKGAVNNVRGRMAEALTREAEKILGEHWENRLKGFCRKAFNKWDVGICSIKELKVCFGFLRKVEKRRERI